MIDESFFGGDELNEECGVFGIFNHPDAAFMTYLGLYSLQHRGQESTGIVSSDGKKLYRHTGKGLVREVFNDRRILDTLHGNCAIGHNRYAKSDTLQNAQPILINYKAGQLAAAINGSLTNRNKLRREMENEGSIFTTTTNTEVIMHLVARSKKPTIAEMIRDALTQIEGAFSLVFLDKNEMIAARDPHGVRPLSIGKLGESFVVASETCAFDLIGAEFVREVKPGEVVRISENGIERLWILPKAQKLKIHAHCIFEHIYFARPDSDIFGDSVDSVRRSFGKMLAVEYEVPKNADLVMGVPDSSIVAALGYAEASKIPYAMGLIRNHYVGRTFILPEQGKRDFSVKIKFNPIVSQLKDKVIVVVDDSIVRGTTMRNIMKLIRAAKPKEIHLRISSPTVLFPCFYGVDMQDKNKLIANQKTVEEIREYLGVDSLKFLSIEGMLEALPEEKRKHYCCACFNGEYPIAIDDCVDGQRGCNC